MSQHTTHCHCAITQTKHVSAHRTLPLRHHTTSTPSSSPATRFAGMVGARFERVNLMEWQHMIITRQQNSVRPEYASDISSRLGCLGRLLVHTLALHAYTLCRERIQFSRFLPNPNPNRMSTPPPHMFRRRTATGRRARARGANCCNCGQSSTGSVKG